MKRFAKLTLLIIVVTVVTAMVGCSMFGNETSDDGTPESTPEEDDGFTTFSGSIGSIESKSSSIESKSLVESKGTFDDLEIVVIYNPQLNWSSNETNYDIFQVNSDGTFTFDVEQGKKFIAFLVDSALEYQKCLGVIGVSTGNNDYWENIDTSQIDGDVNFGKISQSSVDMLLESENNIDSFGGSIENKDLVDFFASVDDSLRILENYINSNYEIMTFPNYQIHNTERTKEIITQWGKDYLNNYKYHGYQFMVSSSTYYGDSVSLEVPYQVEYINETTFNSGDIITDVFDANKEFDYVTGSFYNIPGGGDSLLTNVPTSGDWSFYDSNNNKVAEFNYSLAYPVDPNNTSIFTSIVPRLKVNIENGTEEKIKSLQVRWYKYNTTTSEFEQIDPTYLEKTFDGWSISITDFSKETRVDEYIKNINDFSDKEVSVEKEWYLYDKSKTNHATGIYINVFTNGYTSFYANRQ